MHDWLGEEERKRQAEIDARSENLGHLAAVCVALIIMALVIHFGGGQ